VGDIFPYGPAAYVTWDQVYQWFVNEGYSSNTAAVFAAIATAESGLDYRVINDTPATGDYSVGLFQINYYASLYGSRTAAFGTPEQLIDGGLSRQAYAALQLWLGRGQTWGDWSTYNNGAYRAYLHGYSASGSNVNPTGQPEISEGATGPAVSTLQDWLVAAGYSLAIDGVFGPLTLGAVRDFQAKHGLVVDGIVGPLTWSALAAVVNVKVSAPPPPPPVTTPPPPVEPPGNIDPATVAAWSNVVEASGTGLGQDLQRMAGWANSIGGIS
jgi:hypothetical protein